MADDYGTATEVSPDTQPLLTPQAADLLVQKLGLEEQPQWPPLQLPSDDAIRRANDEAYANGAAVPAPVEEISIPQPGSRD